MSLNPIYTNLAIKSGGRHKSQSIVESKIAEKESDIIRVITINSNVSLIASEVVADEIHYSGRVNFCIVYENGEDKLVSSEYGVEFTHKTQIQGVSPSQEVYVALTMENTELKQLNGNYIISAIASANIEIIQSKTFDYLSGGDGIICKSQSANIFLRGQTHSGTYEMLEELETLPIEKVLMHYKTATLNDIQAGVGCVICSGVVNLNLVCLLADGNIEAISKLCEFRFELDADEVMPDMSVVGSVDVGAIKISAAVDEGRGKSQIEVEILLNVTAQVYEGVQINAAIDLYSTTNNVQSTFETVKFESPLPCQVYNEKIADTAIVSSGEIDNEIIGITAENLNVLATRSGDGVFTVEGVISALALVKDENGKVLSYTLELPFEKQLQLEGAKAGTAVTVSGIAYDILAKVKKEKEVEMQANLIIFAAAYNLENLSLIVDVSLGSELEKNQNAISVFLPKSGDELWDVAKRLGQTGEEVLKYNESLEFPLKGGERIIFYRQEN